MVLAAIAAATIFTTAVAPSGAPSASAANEAYQLAWRGELDAARMAAARVLVDRPLDPGALLVTACVLIETGDVAGAESRVASMEVNDPPVPEARVLRALVVRRRHSASEPMSVALAESWKSAGKPDLSAGALSYILKSPGPSFPRLERTWGSLLRGLARHEAFLMSAITLEPPENGELSTPAGQAYLKAYEDWRKHQEIEARALASDPAANSAALNLALLMWLKDDAAALRGVLSMLTRMLPEDGVVALAALLEGTPDDLPLTASEVAVINEVAQKRSWHETNRVVYAALRDLGRRVDPVHAELFARSAFQRISPTTVAHVKLARRGTATVDPKLRAALAGSLDAAGGKLASGGDMLDRMVGEMLRGYAATLRGEPSRRQELMDAAEERRMRLEQAGKRARWGLWPLPSLWREWSPDTEVPTLERLAG